MTYGIRLESQQADQSEWKPWSAFSELLKPSDKPAKLVKSRFDVFDASKCRLNLMSLNIGGHISKSNAADLHTIEWMGMPSAILV